MSLVLCLHEFKDCRDFLSWNLVFNELFLIESDHIVA